MKVPDQRWRDRTAVLLAVLLFVACRSDQRRQPVPEPAPTAPAVATEDREYLVPPHTDYPLTPDPVYAARVDDAHRALLDGRSDEAGRLIAEVLDEAPDYAPAWVVEAQRRLVEREYTAALEPLDEIVRRHPDYTAAQLVRGRLLIRLGRVPAAYDALRGIASESGVAADAVSDLRPRALEIVGRRVDDALERGRLDAAERNVVRLQQWAPDSPATWRSSARLAVATDDVEAELEAVQRLHRLESEDRAVQERLADLELMAGDPDRALQIYRDLRRRFPDDEALAADLERAEFHWRMRTLPEKVQQKAAMAELTRGDFASLLYWMLPAVRAAEERGGRVASDILDHRDRREIIRVVNLGLMGVDETLHTFRPDRAMRRGIALESLLELLDRRSPRPACLDGPAIGADPSTTRICEAAVRCGFVATEGDCLAGVGVSGAKAVEWIRRWMELTGSG